MERQKRRENNKLSTKINFLAWIIEVGRTELNTIYFQVFGYLFLLLPLSVLTKSLVYRLFTVIVSPLFYTVAAEKEKVQNLMKWFSKPINTVAPMTMMTNIVTIS